jgi:hypothetical protein
MRRHRFDPFSFVFGALFVFLALFVLTGHSIGDLGGLSGFAIVGTVIAALIVLYAGRALLQPTGGSADRPEDDRSPDEI